MNDIALHLLVVVLPLCALAALIIVANVSHRRDHANRDRTITASARTRPDPVATSRKPNPSRPRASDKTRRALTAALGVALGVYAVSELA